MSEIKVDGTIADELSDSREKYGEMGVEPKEWAWPMTITKSATAESYAIVIMHCVVAALYPDTIG